jgi:beta-lactamase regulating signal transducer with metallopeptidase domain
VPGRPTLIVSKGALTALTETELAIAIAHEHAHWDTGRWWESHALFVVRLLQCYNPVALWAFREYCIDVEIACDAVAVAGRDPHQLARILLKIYQSTDRGDVAALASLRKRVDVLLGGGPLDAALPPATVAAAAIFMLVVLPWIV